MDVIEALHQLTKLSPDLLRYAFVIAAGFPLASFYKSIPADKINRKHAFSIISTTILILIVYSPRALVENVTIMLVVYLIQLFFRTKKWSPVLSFGVAMAMMTRVHYKMQVLQDPLDYSAVTMILLIKLTSFAFCAYDGTRPNTELDQYQQEFAIREYPSLLEYFGYMMFFNGSFIGPAFEFQHCHKFVHCLVTMDLSIETL